MHGVSRFLSRRDKNHEKRKSKDARNKVRLSRSASACSLTPLPCNLHRAPDHSRRNSASIETLYQKLPSAWRSSVGDGLLFLQKTTPFRAFVCYTVTSQTHTRHI
jgi:hypothetical protein